MVREYDIKRWMFFWCNKVLLSFLWAFGLQFILSKIKIPISGLEIWITLMWSWIYVFIDKIAAISKKLDRILEKEYTFIVLASLSTLIILDYFYWKNETR